MNGRGLLAFNLRRLRVERGISQERLAADAGIDRAYLSGIERQLENPTVDLLDKIAETLAVNLASLFESSVPDEVPKALRPGRKPAT